MASTLADNSSRTLPASGRKREQEIRLFASTRRYDCKRLQLTVPPAGQQLIDTLTNAAPGDPFNIAFLDNFSDHHVEAIARSTECINQAGHQALRDYCLGIVTAQAKDMDMMRDELASTYGITGDVGAVPEPATWAMMLLGFAGIGFAMRRRSKIKTTVAYS